MMEMRTFYAGKVLPEIGQLLEDAMQAYQNTSQAETLLKLAREQAPTSLAVYFSFYKFLFYKGKLDDAERIVRAALAEAARQGNFPVRWEEQTVETVNWLEQDSPQHFYLFSLKALAFIRLRQRNYEECKKILAKLQELDPQDTLGGSVISSLTGGVH